MNLISAGSISLDSTFKQFTEMFTREDLNNLLMNFRDTCIYFLKRKLKNNASNLCLIQISC
jgi:hypothetical protein